MSRRVQAAQAVELRIEQERVNHESLAGADVPKAARQVFDDQLPWPVDRRAGVGVACEKTPSRLTFLQARIVQVPIRRRTRWRTRPLSGRENAAVRLARSSQG